MYNAHAVDQFIFVCSFFFTTFHAKLISSGFIILVFFFAKFFVNHQYEGNRPHSGWAMRKPDWSQGECH